jgi:ribosomal protein S18 acetylase RimI-like enzyme
MSITAIEFRPLHRDDFDVVVAIDTKVFGQARPDYYKMRFAKALDEKDRLVSSLVAVLHGRVVGFVMSELFEGEFGIPSTDAYMDTVGIHPDFQHKGIGKQLMEEFVGHLKKVGVKRLNTLVGWNDLPLIHFLDANGFEPSKTINLELNLD